MKDANKVLQEEVNRLQEILDIKCDELKEAMLLNAKLRLLLSENGIDHEN